MSGVITPPTPLQLSYDLGNTIVQTASRGITITNTLNESTTALTITRQNSTTNAYAIKLSSGTGTNSALLFVDQSASGGSAAGIDIDTRNVNGPSLYIHDGGNANNMACIEMQQGQSSAVAPAGRGRIIYDSSANAWKLSANTGAYATIGTSSSSTLQAAYNAGPTIATSAGTAIAFSDNSADNGTVLTIDKSPAGAQSGNGITVTMGANSSGSGLSVAGSGTGNSLTVTASGGGAGLNATVTGAAGVAYGVAIGMGAATTAPAIYVNQTTGGSGVLIQLQNNAADKFSVANTGNVTASGVVRVGADSAAAPGFSWTANTNRGMFNNTVDGGVDISVAGAARLQIQSGEVKVPGGVNLRNDTGQVHSWGQDGNVSWASSGVLQVGTGNTRNASGALNLQQITATNNAANNTSVITITKSPVGAQSGNGVDVTMGATTTGHGLAVASSGTGYGVSLTPSGGSRGINVTNTGTEYGIVVTSSGAGFPVGVNNTGANNNYAVGIFKNPAGAQSGAGVDITMGSGGGVTSGAGVSITMTAGQATGVALLLNGDTGYSRVSANVHALGNGTGADASGTLRVTTVQAPASTAFNFGSNATSQWTVDASNGVLTGTVSANDATPRVLVKNSSTGGSALSGFAAFTGAALDRAVAVEAYGPNYSDNTLFTNYAVLQATTLMAGLIINTRGSAPYHPIKFVQNDNVYFALNAAHNWSAVSGSVVGWVSSSSDPTGTLDAGLSRLSTSSAGAGVAVGDGTAGNAGGNIFAGGFWFNGSRGFLSASADGVFRMIDEATTSFGRLCWGPATSSFPSIKRSSATLAFRLADDSADAAFTASSGTLSTSILASANGAVSIGATGTAFKQLFLDAGIDTTAGDSATINKIAGRFRKDTTGTTFTVNNNLVTANSIILLTFVSADITAISMAVTAQTAGTSFVVTFNAAPTANCDVNFLIIPN